MVSRKNFEETARIIRESTLTLDQKDSLAREFARWFGTENERFDYNRFREACLKG